MLLVYLCYLVFQLVSHKSLYDDRHSSIPETVLYTGVMAKRLHTYDPSAHPASGSPPQGDDATGHRTIDGSLEAGPKEDDDDDVPQMGMTTTIALLIVVTVVCH